MSSRTGKRKTAVVLPTNFVSVFRLIRPSIRLSTVRNADKIVVLGSPEGTSTQLTGSVILEQGTHNELMQLEKGFYRALVGTGQGKKSSGLVDDTTDAVTAETASTGSKLKDKVDAASEKSTAAASTDEEEKSGGFSLFAKKDPKEAEKEALEKKKLAENKAKVWTYTKV